MYRRAHPFLVGALGAVLFGTACHPAAPAARLADYAASGQSFVSTDVIYPTAREFDDLLERGWAMMTEHPETTLEGRRVVACTAAVRFIVAVPGRHVLEIEATPTAAEREHELRLFVNDHHIAGVVLKTGWRIYTFEIPAEAVQVGWNRAELRFARLAAPAGAAPAGTCEVKATTVRRLRLRSSLDRTIWSDRPAAVRTRLDASGTSRVEMPADSVLDTYMELGGRPRLVGSVDARAAHIGQADLRAAIDVLDERGHPQTVFEWESAASASAIQPLDVDLDRWSNSAIHLRLRAWGQSNGVIVWQNVGVVDVDRRGAIRTEASMQPLAPPQSRRLGRPDVVVILLDTARADAFDGARPDRPTPHVQALAEQGTRFTQAWAAAPWTGQSVPSILTGWYPEAIGSFDWSSQIPESIPTLSELMAKAGYDTSVWSQHTVYRGNRSFRRGVDRFWQTSRSDRREQLPIASELFAEGKPTFALVHLSAPHHPYTPPPPFRGLLTSWWRSASTAVVGYEDRNSADPVDDSTTWRRRAPTPDEVRYARGRYDETAMYADHLVGRVVDTIRKAGRYDNTLIVVLSDHGEEFYEHGAFFHGKAVYQELLHVPFVMKWPARLRGWARMVAEPVTLIDLVPTLVDGLGLRLGNFLFQGRTLLPSVFEKARPERDLYASTPRSPEDGIMATLRSGHYKIVYRQRSGRAELYDLVSDPAEQMDLATKQPVRTRLLLQRLLQQRERNERLMAGTGGERTEPLDEETIRALRALGYLH